MNSNLNLNSPSCVIVWIRNRKGEIERKPKTKLKPKLIATQNQHQPSPQTLFPSPAAQLPPLSRARSTRAAQPFSSPRAQTSSFLSPRGPSSATRFSHARALLPPFSPRGPAPRAPSLPGSLAHPARTRPLPRRLDPTWQAAARRVPRPCQWPPQASLLSARARRTPRIPLTRAQAHPPAPLTPRASTPRFP